MTVAPRTIRDATRVVLPAASLSGVPSTLHALATGRDPLEAAVAAGSLVLPDDSPRGHLLLAAVPVHVSLSVMWSVVLARVLPRKRPLIEGIIAGLVIAGLDLGLVGRRYPLIRALHQPAQVADHIAFGVVATLVLTGKRGDRDG